VVRLDGRYLIACYDYREVLILDFCNKYSVNSPHPFSTYDFHSLDKNEGSCELIYTK